jgi:endonuclease/exonuclease/phosphatase family metal-dependent hydrolase
MTPLLRAALLSFVLLLALPAAGAQGFHVWKTWDFNMAGNTLHDGNASVNEDSDPVLAIKRSLTSEPGEENDPKFVSLNEVCQNQFQKLLEELRKVDTAWSGHFVQAVDKNNYPGLCNKGGTIEEHDFGNAVLVRGNIVDGSRHVVDIPHPDYATDGTVKAQRRLLCVTADLAVWVRVCSVHLDNDPATDAFRHDQVQAVKDYVEGQVAAGKRVIVMGDFNIQPKNGDFLDRMYDASFEEGAHGVFNEVDQGSPKCRCGAATHNSGKIDYTWVSRRDWNVLDGSVHNPVIKHDHEILRGRIEVRH